MNQSNPSVTLPVSATLARRLSEAADGLRNIDGIYFVAGYALPHRIKDFPDLPSAEYYFQDRNLSPNEYAIFGPYTTNDELQGLSLRNVKDISSAVLTITYADNTSETINLPEGIDSIFLNLSSFDKFVFPYYCQVFGVDYAKKLRDNLITKYQELQSSQTPIKMVGADHPHPYLTIMHGLYGQVEFL